MFVLCSYSICYAGYGTYINICFDAWIYVDQTMFLVQLGSYLKHNKWSRIFFDLTIDVYEDEMEDTIEQPVIRVKQVKKKPSSTT